MKKYDKQKNYSFSLFSQLFFENDTLYLVYLENGEISCLFFDRKKVDRLYDTKNV